MSKLESVTAHIIATLPRGSALNFTRNLKTDDDAIRLVDDVCEGDFDPRTQWDDALAHFKHYFRYFAGYMAELKAEYDSIYGEEMDR